MALRNYITHPDDNSPLVAHVVNGAGGTVIASMFVGRDTTGRLLDNLTSALLINSATPGPLSIVVSNTDGEVKVLGTLSWLES